MSSAQSKLPALEAAKAAAEEHREPAGEAERRWQELHGQLTTLQKDAVKAQKQLREGVVAAAGGEAVATHALVHCHLSHRLAQFRANHGLAGAQEWKVGEDCLKGLAGQKDARRVRWVWQGDPLQLCSRSVLCAASCRSPRPGRPTDPLPPSTLYCCRSGVHATCR